MLLPLRQAQGIGRVHGIRQLSLLQSDSIEIVLAYNFKIYRVGYVGNRLVGSVGRVDR